MLSVLTTDYMLEKRRKIPHLPERTLKPKFCSREVLYLNTATSVAHIGRILRPSLKSVGQLHCQKK